MPGMIDTHRHMWQTAMRAYGADWTLSQYFVWYYLEHGKNFRPQDVYAGQPALGHRGGRRRGHDVGRLVPRPADDRPRRRGGRRAGVGARPVRPGLRQHPGRALGVDGHEGAARLLLAALRRQGRHAADSRSPSTSCRDPSSPSAPPSRSPATWACRSTTHAGVLGATRRRQHPSDARERVHDARHDLRALRSRCRTTPTSASRPAAARRRCRPRASRARARATRRRGSSASSTSRSRSRTTPRCGGARTCSPRCARRLARTARASTSRRTLKGETVTQLGPAVPRRWSTGRRAAAAGRWGWTPRSAASRSASAPTSCCIKNDNSPVMFPIINPYGHVVMQAQRARRRHRGGRRQHRQARAPADQHRPGQAARSTVEETVAFLETHTGQEAWESGMHPDLPPKREIDNPYHYNK